MVKYERVLCSKGVQMRISALSRAEEEEFLNAAISSLPKAQQYLHFICCSKSVLGTQLNTPREILSSLDKQIHSHGRQKRKTPT